MIQVKLNEDMMRCMLTYNYTNVDGYVHLESVLELMDMAICLHEVSDGPPYWFSGLHYSGGGVIIDSGGGVILDSGIIDLSMFMVAEDKLRAMEAAEAAEAAEVEAEAD
jgi:hypothetical protein